MTIEGLLVIYAEINGIRELTFNMPFGSRNLVK
jgi:hypothetical protein